MENQTQQFCGTREVAKRLGVKPATLSKAVWAGNVREPIKGPGNAFLWSDLDIASARRYFRKAVL